MIKRPISLSVRPIIAIMPLAFAAGIAVAEPASDTIEVRPKRDVQVNPDALDGSYKQPQWTRHRLFTNSRAYVLDEHQIEVEAWVKAQTFKDTHQNKTVFKQEIEVGLGHRLQLDLYVNQKQYYNEEKGKKVFDSEGQQIELRYALADWGELPLNPTLYFEYHPVKNNPERFEFRLLLSDNLAANWHYAINLGYEIDLWGQKQYGQPEREIPLDVAIGTTALSPHVSLGAEVKVEWRDGPGRRGHFEQEIDIGPAVQWRPTPTFHLNVSPLWGVKDVSKNVSPVLETWIIAGLEL